MGQVRWTDFALENLIAIGDYIEQDSHFYAQRVVNYLFDAVNILERHPLAGRTVPEFNDKTVRELVRGSYRIVYKVTDEQFIDIVTVHHAAQLLQDIPDGA
jgi:addiction module RelE/StbE family toxin